MKEGTVKVLAVAAVLAFMCMAFACVDANNCNGNNVSESTHVGQPFGGTDGGIDWSYDDNNDVLRISASAHPEGGYEAGVMKDYSENNHSPWDVQDIYYERSTRLIVKDGVKNIGAYAFAIHGEIVWQSLVGSIFLPDSVKEIGPHAFDSSDFDCKLVTSATKIDAYAFKDCKLHGDLDLSKTDYIGCYAFQGSGFNGTLTTNATTIDEGAFQGCNIIGNLDLSKTEFIGDHAFENCGGLRETLTIGANHIGDYAFAKCNLTGIFFVNEEIEYLGSYAFAGCESVGGISLKAVNKIDTVCPYAFGITQFVDENNIPIALDGDLTVLHGMAFIGRFDGTMVRCN